MIEPGKHVKYFLRNGMVLEGIVEKDTAAEVVLKALDGESLIIIHKPAEDIMMTKVVLTEPISEERVQHNLTEAQERIKAKLHEVQQPVDDPELQEKNLTELRQMVLEQERQIIVNKRREHFGSPGAARQAVPYSNPLGLSAYSPRPKQKSIAQKAADQEARILRRQFSRRR
jgi:hypothetical protein